MRARTHLLLMLLTLFPLGFVTLYNSMDDIKYPCLGGNMVEAGEIVRIRAEFAMP